MPTRLDVHMVKPLHGHLACIPVQLHDPFACIHPSRAKRRRPAPNPDLSARHIVRPTTAAVGTERASPARLQKGHWLRTHTQTCIDQGTHRHTRCVKHENVCKPCTTMYPCAHACATRHYHKPSLVDHERMVMRSCASSSAATVVQRCGMLHVMPHTCSAVSTPRQQNGVQKSCQSAQPSATMHLSGAVPLFCNCHECA
jgi:hypothetical protein